MIRQQDAIDEEKLITEIKNLENQLRIANEISMKIQQDTQLFDEFEAKTEEEFNVAISELEARANNINSKMPLIVQDCENLKAKLMDKKTSLQNLEQEDKQLDDALNDCVENHSENYAFSELELENKKAGAIYAEKIELRDADLEELARISKSVQSDVDEIKDNRSEIEKLEEELNNIKDQRNLLNIKSSEISEPNNQEIIHQTEERKLNIVSLESMNLNLLKMQDERKELTSVLEDPSNLDNENITYLETQLKELRQKKEANNEKLESINTAKEETDKRIKNLNTIYEAKMERKGRIEKLIGPQNSLVEPSKLKIHSAPETPKSHIPMKKSRKVEINWETDNSVTDDDPNDLLSRLLKGD